MDTRHWREQLARVYAGRRWILAMEVLAAQRGLVERLDELGAEALLCVACEEGTARPDPELAPDPIVVEIPRADSMMASIHACLDQLADLPDWARARVEDFDPRGQSRVIGAIFDDGRPVAGRAKFGARPLAWQRLENKTVIDAVWDAAGLERPPSQVVPAERGALERAAAQLDAGHGTVWVPDNREGFHGGAEALRWVRTPDQAERAAAYLSGRADTARVTPFLEGLPCSIHGFVFPEHTLALRPCEMLVLRRPGQMTLHYASAATFWDPPPADREAMRRAARRLGDHLREAVGYRGAFTLDGVLTEGGFLPTELNPRFGAALGAATAGAEGLPIQLLNLALVEGAALDWRPHQLEALLLEAADEVRAGGAQALSARVIDAPIQHALVFEAGAFRLAQGEETRHAKLTSGPHPMGSFTRVHFDAEHTPTGPSSAPRAAAALTFADELLELGLGPLEPAPPAR